jgi:cytochrome c-type biogenesis protein CcsB
MMPSFFMTYLSLETFFANGSFLFLFCSMIAYWIQMSFRLQKPNLGFILCLFANISLFALLTLRWKESGHFPLSNLYESLMFLSWSLTAIQLFLGRLTNQSFLGALTSPMALLTNTFATFSLPLDMKTSSALVPALQSNWLIMHVTVMILSYSALIFGSLLAIAFLILTWQADKSIVSSNAKTTSVTADSSALLLEYTETLSVESKQLEIQKSTENPSSKFFGKTTIELARMIDNFSYRILGIGFPLLTIGILSGAVWANEAWGSYWSWDPKETWALLTWLVFAIYLHTRLNKGWEGKKPAFIASFGFFVVWMCFLGVNLLGEGLHSYGWLMN